MDSFDYILTKNALKYLSSRTNNIKDLIKEMFDEAENIKNMKRLSRNKIISNLEYFAISLELILEDKEMENKNE